MHKKNAMDSSIRSILLQITVFATLVNVSKLDLQAKGVCILWKWEWTMIWNMMMAFMTASLKPSAFRAKVSGMWDTL